VLGNLIGPGARLEALGGHKGLRGFPGKRTKEGAQLWVTHTDKMERTVKPLPFGVRAYSQIYRKLEHAASVAHVRSNEPRCA